jgi:F0F1-type ATP synthase assembly protein I
LQLALSIVAFLFLGQWLDRRLGTDPWLTMLGVFVGAGAAFYSMYRRLMADQRREESLRNK